MLYQYADPIKRMRDALGRIHLKLGDWKRANKLRNEYSGKNAKKGTKPCTRHLFDSKLSHYRIQVMIYAWILMEYYGVVIDEMFVLGLHPSQEDFDYIPVEWNHELIESIIAYRRSCIVGGGGDPKITTVEEFVKQPEVREIIYKRCVSGVK